MEERRIAVVARSEIDLRKRDGQRLAGPRPRSLGPRARRKQRGLALERDADRRVQVERIREIDGRLGRARADRAEAEAEKRQQRGSERDGPALL